MVEYRSIFLKEFTKELIFNIDKINLGKTNSNIENFNEISERIRKRVLGQIESEYEYNQMRNQIVEATPKVLVTERKTNPLIKSQTKENMDYKENIIEPPVRKIVENRSSIQQPQVQSIKFSSTADTLSAIKNMFNDPRVTMVECVGKDQFLLVRTSARVMLTRIKLTENEIKDLIEIFSKDTRIPVVNGLLNATKDNLNLSAIISDVAGSRFLIKKVFTNEFNQ
jgi:hypothetical protein